MASSTGPEGRPRGWGWGGWGVELRNKEAKSKRGQVESLLWDAEEGAVYW